MGRDAARAHGRDRPRARADAPRRDGAVERRRDPRPTRHHLREPRRHVLARRRRGHGNDADVRPGRVQDPQLQSAALRRRDQQDAVRRTSRLRQGRSGVRDRAYARHRGREARRCRRPCYATRTSSRPKSSRTGRSPATTTTAGSTPRPCTARSSSPTTSAIKTEQPAMRAAGRLVGVGMALTIEPSSSTRMGSFNAGYYSVYMRLDPTGRVYVFTGGSDEGPDHTSAIAQLDGRRDRLRARRRPHARGRQPALPRRLRQLLEPLLGRRHVGRHDGRAPARRTKSRRSPPTSGNRIPRTSSCATARSRRPTARSR